MVFDVSELPVHVPGVVAVEREEVTDIVDRLACGLLAEGRRAFGIRYEQVAEQRYAYRQQVVWIEASYLGCHVCEPRDLHFRLSPTVPGVVKVGLVMQVPGEHPVVV